MSFQDKLRFAKNPAEVSLVLRAATVLFALPALLKFMNINGLVRILTPTAPPGKKGAIPEQRVAHLCVRTIGISKRFFYHSNCLRRSLVLYHCLRRHGIPVVIHFGAKKQDDTLTGHCWLTLNGRLYHDREDMVSQFAHMFSLPAAESALRGGSVTQNRSADVKALPFDG